MIDFLVRENDFKAINDTHGHAAGDAMLTATAGRLTGWCGHHGIAARLGGDEFAAIVTDPAHTAGLFALRIALDEPVHHHGQVLRVSAADAAIYASKGHGRRNNSR